MHRAAFTDSTFQRSLALEDAKERPFCTSCHAPSGVAAEGVTCASCHARPHAQERATCTVCHEFTFDRGRTELVQKTMSEHAQSAFANVSCARCHAPPVAGHVDHRFVSGHAPWWIAERVHVEAVRQGEALLLSIDVDAGHAFPTGDMFRRARLEVFAEDAAGRIVDSAERSFGRTWGALVTGERTQLGDTRIRGTWREAIPLDAPRPIVRVRFRLLFERVVAVDGPHADVVSKDEVARGELAW